jgi:protein involved in polysaccharide export with SLBB domain
MPDIAIMLTTIMNRASSYVPAAAIVFLVALPAATVAQDTMAEAEAEAERTDVLRPGDIVALRVWREASFSGEFSVDGSGRVVLPRLGMIDVTGVPTSELRAQILEGLGQYLRNPSIDVVFMRRVAIYGAVSRAGLYPVDPTMTVLDALALAGGARGDGRLDRIRLIRDGQEIMVVPTTSAQMEELRIRSGDQLFVPEQSWFRRHALLVATGISTVTSVVVALLYISRS